MKRLSFSNLRIGMVLEEDIYSANNRVVPLVKRGAVLDWPLMTKLLRHNIQSVYVNDESVPQPQGQNFRNLIPPSAFNVPAPKPIIEDELKVEALENLEDLFHNVSIDEGVLHESSLKIITHLDQIVEQLVNSLEDDRHALININDLKSYDEYTYHHSLSVAVLSISIGQYLNLSADELNRLGKCSIMHDIGKTAIPLEIINKPSKLDDDEFRIVKGHSTAGFDYLTSRGIGDEEMWSGVLHHHEKYDGSGYPNGLKGEEIPLWSRIITVADVYDALTSNRPYRKPMQPSEAIEYILGGSYSSFDFDMVDAFSKRVNLYPVGSVIELSNMRYAVVLDTYNHLRPVVRAMDNGEVIDLFRNRHYLSIVINRVVPEVEYTLSIAQ
ncbi:HD-GYP domain-containing protein [Ruminococcaceae bacterium OttesenSCG-928-L11]|nr:HD-GYP domain-containing protein [Ruminococcaceae bacterium OttesenSCG-928-L11]